MYTLVPAQAGDAPVIAGLFIAARREMDYLPPSPHSPADTVAFFAGLISDPHLSALGAVTEEGTMVGFCVFGEGRLDHLYVAPRHQDHGAGSELLRAAQADSAQLEGWVFQPNLRALAFYERHGFEAVERTDGSRNEEGVPDVRISWRRGGPPAVGKWS